MILPEVTGAVTDARLRFVEYGGVFIEHAHRLEVVLTGVWCANHDGNVSGYELTNKAWNGAIHPSTWGKIMDKGGKFADAATVGGSQVGYRHEAGRFLVGRYIEGKQLPHIFVIGHTHAAQQKLNYISLNDASDAKGPGLMIES